MLQSNEIRIQDYIGVVYRKKWAVIVSFILVLGVSSYYALSKPPVYTSSATVKIDARTLNPRGDVVQNITQSVEYYERIFGTGIFQKEVIDSLSTDVEVWVIAQREQISLDELVRWNLSLQADNVQGFFRITASSSHPELAYRLAAVSSQLFQRRLRDIESQNIKDSDTYLDDQITLLQTRLEELEIESQRFLRNNALVAIRGQVKGKSDFSSLQQQLEQILLSQELTEVKLQSYRRKRDEILNAKSISASAIDQEYLNIDKRIRDIASVNDSLKTLRTGLLEQYDYTHPEIEALTREINNNRLRRLDIEARLAESGSDSDDEGRNMLALIQSKIANGEDQLFELGTDIEYYQYKLRRLVDENPDLFDQEMERELEYNRLRRSKNLFETTYNMLIQKREEQRFSSAMQTGGVKMIDPAKLPDTPIPSNASRQILFGAIIGLSLGLGGAFLLEYMDTSLKNSEDVTRFLDLPLMGEIPKIKKPSSKSSRFLGVFTRNGLAQETGYENRLISSFSPKEPIPEAYRNVRTSLQFAFVDEPLQCFVISSPGASEGKSLTTANLGIGFAQSGKRTLLIDTDLRRPVMHKVFGINREPGITDVLAGQADIADAIQSIPIQGLEGLYVLPAGQSTPNPGELINSQRMNEVLDQLKNEVDIVLMDSPPVIAAIDAAILGSKTQGLLLVFHMDETKREAAKYCIEQLERAGTKVIGGLLNNIDVDRKYGYYYSYRYYYRYKYYYDSDNDEPQSG